jgi:hypothetical protein
MKRFVIIECDDGFSTIFVSVHEGRSIVMTPILANTLKQQCNQAVSAVPTDNMVGIAQTRSELVTLLEKCVFNRDWKLNTDWMGNRVHYGRLELEPSAPVDQSELILSELELVVGESEAWKRLRREQLIAEGYTLLADGKWRPPVRRSKSGCAGNAILHKNLEYIP